MRWQDIFLNVLAKEPLAHYLLAHKHVYEIEKKLRILIIVLELHSYCRQSEDGSKMVECESKLQKWKFGWCKVYWCYWNKEQNVDLYEL